MPFSGLLAGTGQASRSIQSPDLFPFRNLVQRMLPMERVRELYRRAQQPINRSLLENVLSEMRVEYQVSDIDLSRVPSSGPALVTANHPFGILDGAILGALLMRVRPDVKVLTNFLLAEIPELHERCIFVDPFGGSQAPARNGHGLRQAVNWLRHGGMLAMFPAGEVSHIRLRQMEIADASWSPAAARLMRLTGAQGVPVFFNGCNSAPFQTMGLLHPRLRTAWLLHEFLGQTDRTVEVRIGSSVPPDVLEAGASDREAVEYLRWRTYLLAQRDSARRRTPLPLQSVLPRPKLRPVAAAALRQTLLDEFARLRANGALEESREYSVYMAQAGQVPALMQELGRLREITFREAGEGTGKGRDLDRFDRYYHHLLLWSKTNNELVGGYRLGLTEEILPRHGVSGFYTSTLFRYQRQVFDRLGPAVELGRSFVRPEYQRQYAPLLMLWKGIGRYLAANPRLAVLFGAVSISGRYNRVSRELIVRFFQARERKHEISRLITPRHPFHAGWIRPGDCPAACEGLKDLEDLADPIGDVEVDGKGIPILLKQYARLGGRLVSFNVDRKFSGVLDGLVLVDLRQTDPVALGRYMGKEGVAAFRRYHGLSEPP